jgi:predicted metal-dependent hydrolase
MNHGQNFWKFVSFGIENYLQKRETLKSWNNKILEK